MRTTVSISKETKEFLNQLKRAVKKVTGKEVTYDETVRILIDAFLMDERNCKGKQENSLRERAKVVCSFLNFPVPEEPERFFYFIPPEIAEEVVSLSKSLKIPPTACLIKLVQEGLETYEYLTYKLPKDLTLEFLEWWEKLSPEERKKVTERIDKKLTACFRGEFIKLKRKLKTG